MTKSVHVIPYIDGEKYKNGKNKIKWIVKTNEELEYDKRTTRAT